MEDGMLWIVQDQRGWQRGEGYGTDDEVIHELLRLAGHRQEGVVDFEGWLIEGPKDKLEHITIDCFHDRTWTFPETVTIRKFSGKGEVWVHDDIDDDDDCDTVERHAKWSYKYEAPNPDMSEGAA
jgi:hypothetical protein